jgi:hypothetical protein
VSEIKEVAMNKAQQEKLENVLRKITKERKATIVATLDTRLTYRVAEKKGDLAYAAYSRFLLSDGHVAYVDLRKMTASVSKSIDKFAQGKVEKRAKKAAAREARKAARLEKEETKAAAKETKAFEKLAKTVKASKGTR